MVETVVVESTLTGIFGGGFVSWLITDLYSKEAVKDLNRLSNSLIASIEEQTKLILKSKNNEIAPEEAVSKNSEIVNKVAEQVHKANRNYRVHVNSPRCTTCGSDSHWNGLRCMNCGQMDDGDY